MKPTASFKTIGCRLNQAETASIAAQFEVAGYVLTEAEQPCDIAVINTCTITHSAERDCARWARRLRRAGARHVILAGCAVEHDGLALQKATGADLIAGQTQKYVLPEMIFRELGIGKLIPDNSETATLPAPPVFSATRALVKVQDGCDFRCSYCIVPETRGAPKSRPLQEILDDVSRLVDAGHREVILTGANLGCYAAPPHGLIDLLQAVESLSGIARFRIGSIESTTVEREVIDFMAASRKLCRFLHLPLQSGDDGVLQRMRRRYSAAQYRETVEYAALKMPDIGLGTDVITGFPGETAAAYHNTERLIQELPFSNLHVFSYSPRRGTPAAVMSQQIPNLIKKERTAALIAIGNMKRRTFAQSFISRPVTLLVEQTDDQGYAIGWTEAYLPVRFEGPPPPRNTLVTCVPERLVGDTLISCRVQHHGSSPFLSSTPPVAVPRK